MNKINDNENLGAVYNEFIKRNKLFWDKFSPDLSSLSHQAVLVDCLVDFPPYVLGNLILAKYFQKREKSRIFAVVRDTSQLRRNLSLLKSFSVEEVFTLDANISMEFDLDFDEMISERDVKKLRKLILDFSFDGIPIGDLIYDAYLRDTGLPTITSLEKSLMNYFYLAIKYFKIYSLIFDRNQIIATIQGHTIYLMYGLLARIAVKHGASVFGRKPGGSPTAIRRYKDLNEFPGYEACFLKEHFNYVKENKKDAALAFAKQFLDKRISGGSKVSAFDEGRKRYDKNELLNMLGLSIEKPTAVIMPHVFSDGPHSDSWMLYNDYFEWFQDTLSIASKISNINWIVKSHPDDKQYNCDIDYAAFESKKYVERFNNIGLIPEDFHGGSISNLADIVITVRGTAAIEFPCLGIPCIMTGTRAFAGYGFTIEPKTKNEYFDVLNNIQNISRLSEDQIESANISLYVNFYFGFANCVFIPNVICNWFSNFDPLYFWSEALESISRNSVLFDPLYNCFNYMIENDLPYLIQYYEMF